MKRGVANRVRLSPQSRLDSMRVALGEISKYHRLHHPILLRYNRHPLSLCPFTPLGHRETDIAKDPPLRSSIRSFLLGLFHSDLPIRDLTRPFASFTPQGAIPRSPLHRNIPSIAYSRLTGIRDKQSSACPTRGNVV